MTNLRKHFGVRIRIANEFDAMAWSQTSEIARSEGIAPEEWFILLHSVTLESVGEHWGVPSLADRVRLFRVQHTVNPKQIKNRQIRFYSLPKDQFNETLWCQPEQVRQGSTHHSCTVKPNGEVEEVRLLFATFVSRYLPEKMRKITLQVSATPTDIFRSRMLHPAHASKVTKQEVWLPMQPNIPRHVQLTIFPNGKLPVLPPEENSETKPKRKRKPREQTRRQGDIGMIFNYNHNDASGGGAINTGKGNAAGGSSAINKGSGSATGGSSNLFEVKHLPSSDHVREAAEKVKQLLHKSQDIDAGDKIEIEGAVTDIERYSELPEPHDKSILERVEAKLKSLASIAEKGKTVAGVLTPILSLFGVHTS